VLFDAAPDPAYMAELECKTLHVLEQAFSSLASAELYATETECSTLAFHRRFIMKNGKTLTNPGKLNPEIDHPEGGIDPKIILMEVRQDERPVLLIANISNHTDTIGGDIVSADWPGRMEKTIQESVGYDLPVMTIIAPQGNINHFNVKTPDPQGGYAEACRIGKAYAAVILSSLYQLKKVDDCTINVKTSEFEAPYLQLTDEEYAEAKKVYEENKDAVMADPLYEQRASEGFRLILQPSFDDAVYCAADCANSEDTVLLSPACASFDAFPNFEVRGDHFRELVQRL
jgi:hypothetical protein